MAEGMLARLILNLIRSTSVRRQEALHTGHRTGAQFAIRRDVEATGALARAYLYSDLSDDDRAAAEGAMIMLLDDPSPLVRRALAEALAGSPDAPYAVIHALASDHAEIAALVLARSPLFIDAELVDLVAIGGAISRRRSPPVCHCSVRSRQRSPKSAPPRRA